MTDIYGPRGSRSSSSADLQLSSESKSPPLRDSHGYQVRVRTCKKCGIEKPYSEFYANSKGQIRTECKDCSRKDERYRKAGKPDQVSRSHVNWRKSRRGYALTNTAKHRAKVREIPFDLDPKDIQRRIDLNRCELTGIPFDLETPWAWNAPSLDQIDPGKGYTKTNVRVVLHAINVMANTWGPEKILEIAAAIVARRKVPSEQLQASLTEKLKQRYDPNSLLYSLTWKERTTPSGRPICALRASKARISGSDYILQDWPTPCQQDGPNGGPNGGPSQGIDRLPSAVQLSGWPTTTTRDHKDGTSEGTVPLNALLGRQVWLAGWPTAMAGTPAQNGNNEAGNTDSSRRTVWLAGWPTTNATDSTGPGREGREGGANLQTAAAETQMPNGPMRLCSDGTLLTGSTAGMESGGRLNPAHSRWLMRLPPEWDACAPLETRSTRKQRSTSVQPSGKSAMEYDL